MTHAQQASGPRSRRSQNAFVETLQSLIVAFVLAMTFRGFVTEGFVIPTGSMAPTLLGQHKRLHGAATGWDFAVGFDPNARRLQGSSLPTPTDPMLGPDYPGSGSARSVRRTQMGDRILVLKSLYRFSSPSRYDVVVFKNPTNPNGPDGNYIKRLIGLPGESIWLVDGDVFAGSADAPDDYAAYRIQRKPEHVQRAVWQPVFHSDYHPIHADEVGYRGPPWGPHDEWETRGTGSYRCRTAEPTSLEWDSHVRQIDDWQPYNFFQRTQQPSYVSDLRVAAAIVPETEGLETTFVLETRGHTMEFILAGGTARVRMRSSEYGDAYPDEGWEGSDAVEIGALPAGRATDVEFWHVDQALSIFIDGRRVVDWEYTWAPDERLRHVTLRYDDPIVQLAARRPAGPPAIRWRFEGSPVVLHRVRLDRDLHYRVDRLNEHARRNPTNPGFASVVRAGNYGFGTHPTNLAILGDEHFFMAGDNSPASSDSRLWGNPHPLVASQIDPSPFVVHRKLLLGKAWVVYFPAPLSVKHDGKPFVPDFGRLRFIR